MSDLNTPMFSFKQYLNDKQKLTQTGTVDAGIQTKAPRSPGSRGLQKVHSFIKDPVHMMGENTDLMQRPGPANPNPNSVSEKKLDVPTPSIPELAKKHGVSEKNILDQLKKGLRVEAEHTTDFETAKEIALDHINELPDYYDRLKMVESITRQWFESHCGKFRK